MSLLYICEINKPKIMKIDTYTTTLLDGAVSLLIDGFDEFGCTRSFLHLEGPLDGTCKLLVTTRALCVLAGEHFAVECGL